MSNVIIAIITGLCSITGAYLGVRESNKLTNFRLKSLEDQVKELLDYKEELAVIQNDIKTLYKRIGELK